MLQAEWVIFIQTKFKAILAFLEQGGDILLVVFFATLLLWSLIIERYVFIYYILPKIIDKNKKIWHDRSDWKSWTAHQIRKKMISELSQSANASLGLIQTLVAICPMLGLMGTVTGMIAVFDVMALMGTANPRLMAGGISMATIPTMAGMVAALSGLYFSSRLQSRVKYIIESFSESLTFD